MRKIIGCDPGLQGALSLIDNDGQLFETHKLPSVKHGRGSGRILNHKLISDYLLGVYGLGYQTLAIESMFKGHTLIGAQQIVESCASVIGFKIYRVNIATWQHWAYNKSNNKNKKLSAAWLQQKGYDVTPFHKRKKGEITDDVWYDACEAFIIGRYIQERLR